MGQIWGLGLPELGLCPGEEVGDSVVVESLVPLIPEDLCEELTWGHQAFHWPWGEGPEGWVVQWDSHPPHLQSLPALAVGAAAAAAAAADSASFVSASWLRQWLQRDLEGSEEGARWDSVSASGGAVDSEVEAPAISLPEGCRGLLCGRILTPAASLSLCQAWRQSQTFPLLRSYKSLKRKFLSSPLTEKNPQPVLHSVP